MQGIVGGHAVLVGRPALLAEWSQYLTPDLGRALEEAQTAGRTAVAVGWDGSARAVLVVADTVKPTSSDVLAGEAVRETGVAIARVSARSPRWGRLVKNAGLAGEFHLSPSVCSG